MVPTRIRFLITPLLFAWHCGPRIRFGSGGGPDAPNRLFMKGVRLSVSIFYFFSLSDWLCLRSSRPKYNASTINYLLFFSSTLWPKINNFPSKERSLCLSHKLKHGSRGKDRCTPGKTINITDATCSVMMSCICGSQMRQITLMPLLGSDSDHCAFHQSTQYKMAVRPKACGAVTVGRWGLEVGAVPCMCHQ